MKSEIIKQAFKLGNSAGVLLPKEWNNKKVKIQLIEKSIEENILEMLIENKLLSNIIGIYLCGSYARGDEEADSDIDILIITDNVNKQIKKGIYDLVFISKDKFIANFQKSLYLASLLNESKSILNNDFIKEYKKIIPELAIKKNINEIKLIIKINEESIAMDKQLNKKVSDETLYSIILRIRELYLMSCLIHRKQYNKQEFLNSIKSLIGSIEPYQSYLRIKNDNVSKEVISVDDARKLIEYSKKLIKNFAHDKKS